MGVREKCRGEDISDCFFYNFDGFFYYEKFDGFKKNENFVDE